jgi:hypothetical protein
MSQAEKPSSLTKLFCIWVFSYAMWIRFVLSALFASMLTVVPTSSFAEVEIVKPPLTTTCISLKSGSEFLSKTGKCNPRIYESRTWYEKNLVPPGPPGSKIIDLKICTSKKFATSIISKRGQCYKSTQVASTLHRSFGPPAAPSIKSLRMGLLGTASIAIVSPVDDGGARITSYVVTSMPGGLRTTIAPSQLKSAEIKSLVPGTEYSFVVVAVNKNGESVASLPTTQNIAPKLPDAPTITNARLTGANSVELSFAAPASDGGAEITSYVATSNPSGLQTTVHQSSGGTINIKNLTHSTSYTFSLVAYNAAGPSPASASSGAVTTAIPVPTTRTPTPVVAAAPIIISVAAIAGVTAPVTGATPVTTTTAGTGYTGVVTWASSGGAVVGNFAAATTYTASITLTAAAGYTFTGVSENFFTVAGATTDTNPANSGVITAVFPATASTVISIAAIAGVTAPVTGATPVTTTTAGTGYTGTVSWSGTPTTFGPGTTYTATITLTPTSGYTLTGVTANFFTVAGATPVTHSANSGVITAEFPATAVGDPSKIAITRASVGTQRRTAFTTQPQITVQDSAGNTITSSSDVVTATVSAGGTLVGATTATASSGVATFTGLGVDGSIGTTYTITYTVTGLTVATATVTLTGTTCNGSFICQVGDTGPGGGVIFYAVLSSFTCGPTRALSCFYLEAAPWLGARDQWSRIDFDVTLLEGSVQATKILWTFKQRQVPTQPAHPPHHVHWIM